MTDSAATVEPNEGIKMSWGQEVAASWSIFWPCWVLSFFVEGVLLLEVSPESLIASLYLFPLLILCLGERILSFRLVRKNYRSFWIGVVREGDAPRRKLSLREGVRLWPQLLAPLVVFQGASYLLPLWTADETANSLNSFEPLLYILVVGPLSIRWAMKVPYPDFRLQAYNRWSDPRSGVLMFLEENYVNPEEPDAVSAAHKGCVWAGCLYARKSGGFDLFYDHANSEFKPLDLEAITRLRHLCESEGGLFFIAHLDGKGTDRNLLEEAEHHLRDWVAGTVLSHRKSSS